MSEREHNPVGHKPSTVQQLVRLVVALAALGLGFVVLMALVATRPQPKMVPRENLGELVEVHEVTPSRQVVRVPVTGQVMAAQQMALIPEVAGRVVWLSDALIPGGYLAAGDRLVRIDPREYSLAMEQQIAQLDRAQTELEVERSRKQIAEREWQLMGDGKPADALAIREPQLRTAEASLKAARSGLDRARLSVDRTQLRAPFNAMVQSKSVALGQLVAPPAPLGTLIGTDAFWVLVSVPVDRLSWIRIPGVNGARDGAGATITQRAGERMITREGTVIRLLPDLDPVGRMARVLIEIPDPLGLKSKAQGQDPGLPLLIGAYVSVEIDGPELDDVVELPREALRGGDRVHVMADGDVLDIRDVQVIWRRRDTVVVGGGLAPGDEIVISPLATPVKGMKLRRVNATGSAAQVAPEPAGEGSASGKALAKPVGTP